MDGSLEHSAPIIMNCAADLSIELVYIANGDRVHLPAAPVERELTETRDA